MPQSRGASGEQARYASTGAAKVLSQYAQRTNAAWA